jgi:hypothetical protein
MTKLDVSSSELALAALTAMALIICFTTFNGASAESISKSKYQALEKNIMAEYNAAKIRCELLVGRKKTFCDTNSEIAKENSLADLDSSFAITILQPKMEKSSEFKQDKTVKFDDFDYKSNPFVQVEFDNIFHVKA